jgi:hypothetical protein
MAETMERGVNNIAICTPHDDLYEKLKVGWCKIAEESVWPRGSDKVTSCEFKCYIHLRPVMDFCWDDYKGGMLNSYDEISRKERSEFYEYLENSAGLIFCVPADTINRILDGDDQTVNRAVKELNDLNRFIFKSIDKITDIPITVAITKSDLLKNEDAKKAASEIIKDRLNHLFGEGNGVSVLLVPVSLGKDLGEGEQGGKITKGVINADPKEGHIHLPIMFNLYFAIKDYIKEKSDALSALYRDLFVNSGKLSTVSNHNALQRWFNGENIDNLRSNLSYLEERINEEKENLKVLNDDLEKVRKEFTNDCEYYVNGKLQKF